VTIGLSAAIRAAIDAHGGAARWNRLNAVEATISARGSLFTAKRRPPLERVRVVAADGTVVARRMQPRGAFRGWRRQFYWDLLDLTYFGGYATCNYFTSPLVVPRAAHVCEALREFVGLIVPTRRTVQPLPIGSTPMPFPTLVAIQVHDFDALT
jgi:hypothetical protein